MDSSDALLSDAAAHADGDGGRQPLLTVRGLRSGYGEVPVLRDIEFDVAAGETMVLLGLNGAGKTTTAMCLCGEIKPWGGTIHLDGEDVTGSGTVDMVRKGLVVVPEGRRVFPSLTVEQNLTMGAWSRRRDRAFVEARKAQAFDYFKRLYERRDQAAGTLSGGEQQMLAIGRGLMSDPRLLIIDEASLGLAPVLVNDVFSIVAQINDDGVTVILIEQNVGALEVADSVLVMEHGSLVHSARGDEVGDRGAIMRALVG